MGTSCETAVACRYWDARFNIWSEEGCVSQAPPSGVADGFLYCNCTHLTDFGGMVLPVEDLLATFTNVKFNFFSMDDAFSILSNFDIAVSDAAQPCPLFFASALLACFLT